MSMASTVAVVVFVTCLSPRVQADEWYEVTIYRCDLTRDVLTIMHLGAYNDRGEALLKEHAGLENLSMPVGERDTPGEDWRVVRQCKLSSGVVEIEVTPGYKFVGDGECGAWSTDQIRISTRVKYLFDRLLQPWCSSDEIISEIVVDGSTLRVDVTMKTGAEFYR